MDIKSSIWAVGGAKGGVGKSFFSTNLALALSMDGRNVILVDADPAGPGLHTLFGIQLPAHTLEDYLEERVGDISEVTLPTASDNLKVICGASDILELANPRYPRKHRLENAISGLGADYVITDIGAGVGPNNLDFFNLADIGFIVTGPEPPSVRNAYGFLKLALLRRVISQFSDDQDLKSKVASMLEGESRVQNMNEMLDALKAENEKAHERAVSSINKCNYKLVLNRTTAKEGHMVARTMVSAVKQFLKIDLKYIGAIDFDSKAEESALVPLELKPDSPVTGSIKSIVRRVAANGKQKSGKMEKPPAATHKPATPFTSSASRMQVGLNNDVNRHGIVMHVQTEDLGFDKEKILTLVFSDGRILFSKTTDYSELEDDSLQKNIIQQVNWQHRAVLTGINTGKLDEKLGIEEK